MSSAEVDLAMALPPDQLTARQLAARLLQIPEGFEPDHRFPARDRVHDT